MTWLVWLALAVLVAGFAAVTGIKPSGTRHVAHTRLMGVARIALLIIIMIVAIVPVRTNAGYGPNPGHPGTGTILTSLCSQSGSPPTSTAPAGTVPKRQGWASSPQGPTPRQGGSAGAAPVMPEKAAVAAPAPGRPTITGRDRGRQGRSSPPAKAS